MTFELLLFIMGLATGLEVGPVHLVDDKRYISYQLGPGVNNSLLECPIQLSEGEELQQITWVLWDDHLEAGTYNWLPSGQGKATGLLEGVVNLSREDGGLELTELRYNLGGFYSCSATLTDGQVQEAAKWEALVIDTTSNSYFYSSSSDVSTCTYAVTIRTPAIFPLATVRCGTYSKEQGGFSDEVPSQEWYKVVQPSGATSYSLEDRSFKIDGNTASDAEFLFTLGVLKTNGTYISLTKISGDISLWQSEGCVLPEVGPHQVLSHTGYVNCRNQLELTDPIKAKVSCGEGYYPEGEVTTVNMECNMETLKWMTEDGSEPILENLQCVIGGGGGGGNEGRMVNPAALLVGTSLLLCLLYQ